MPRVYGKLAPVTDDRVPAMRAVMGSGAAPPPSCNWYAGMGEMLMLDNDNLGDCVPCAALHSIVQRTSYAGRPIVFNNNDADNLYAQWKAPVGEGCIIADVLAKWASSGVPLPGGDSDILSSYVTVNHQNSIDIQMAINATGSVIMGVNLPQEFEDSPYIWDLPDGPSSNIVGGHCILLVGYEPTALGVEFDLISWGARYRMTERAMMIVADEAYAVLDPIWCDKEGVNPAGIDWGAAEAAMEVIKRG